MADQQQGPPTSIRIVPGGLVSNKPPHLIGQQGAAPFSTTPSTIDGFRNLINLNGDVAWALLNGSTDEKATDGVAWLALGGNTKGSGDNVDVVTQALMSWIIDVNLETGVGNPSVQKLNANGEITTGAAGGTTGTHYGAYGQVFTTAGTVTLTAASNVVVGAGSTWTTDILTANYAVAAANLSRNTIEPGDILVVGAAASRIYFRIIEVTNDTHLKVFPTPTAGNPALGAGKAYNVIRTGYGSWSRVENIIIGTSDQLYGYYAGNSGLSIAGTFNHRPGTVEAVQIYDPTATGPAAEHFQAPKSVDSAGAFLVDLQADDVIYYKGFLLYAAGSAISWSIGGFPGAVPFGPGDFPAKNIEVLDRSGRFVSFEQVGDQVFAIFEDATWLCTATGSVPEFAFYRLPEKLSIEHAARAEPCGIVNGLVFGRPSCSARGSVFYVSNRGLEQFSGGLAEEASEPIAPSIISEIGTVPYHLSWDNGFDLVLWRTAFGSASLSSAGASRAFVYAVGTKQWSTIKLQQVTGSGIAALTMGVSPKTQINDEVRLLHLGYYEILAAAGTPLADGGDIRHLVTGLDRVVQQTGLVAWSWRTPVIPLGIEYPDFQFGGFIFDSMTLAGTPVDISWTLYSGSSPYNMVARQTSTALTQVGAVTKSTWTSSNDRQGQKEDLAFIQLFFTGTSWVQGASVILLAAPTQAKR